MKNRYNESCRNFCIWRIVVDGYAFGWIGINSKVVWLSHNNESIYAAAFHKRGWVVGVSFPYWKGCKEQKKSNVYVSHWLHEDNSYLENIEFKICINFVSCSNEPRPITYPNFRVIH